MDEPKKLSSMLIEYDNESKGFRWRFEGEIPADALIGTLEVVKATLVNQQIMKIMAGMQKKSNGRICMPDGSPPPFPQL